MADRTFESMITRVNPSVPGCPNFTILQYIRDAAIRVCERTLAWRYEVPLFDLLPGVYEYAYNKPSNTNVHAVFAALVNDRPLEKLTLDDALLKYPMWANLYSGQPTSVLWSLTPPGSYNTFDYNDSLFNEGEAFVLPPSVVAEGGTPVSICQVTPEKFVVLPLPDGTQYTMRMFVALKPKRDATGMDEFMLDELEEVIMHGALQHLLVLPNANWSDRELATYHSRQYLFHLTERRARANLGNVRGTMYAKMQSFGA